MIVVRYSFMQRPGSRPFSALGTVVYTRARTHTHSLYICLPRSLCSDNSRRLWLSESSCWKDFAAFVGLVTFRQIWLLENWPRLRERSWIFSSETATAFLSLSGLCLSLSLSLSYFLCLSFCLSFLSLFPFFHLFLFLSLSLSLSLSISICLCLSLSLCLYPSLRLCLCPSLRLCLSPSIRLCLCPSLSLSPSPVAKRLLQHPSLRRTSFF